MMKIRSWRGEAGTYRLELVNSGIIDALASLNIAHV